MDDTIEEGDANDENMVVFTDKDGIVVEVTVMEGEGITVESDCRSPPLPEPLPLPELLSVPLPLPMVKLFCARVGMAQH